MFINSSQLQSLISRNSEDITQVYREIASTAAMLTPMKYRFVEIVHARGTFTRVCDGDDDYNKPFYAILSKLQDKRKRLEALQRDMKRELKLRRQQERAAAILEEAGFRSTNEATMAVIHVR
jgi:hypothetical protein